MALSLTERVHGRKVAESLQLVIEYDPQPPFNSGSRTKVDASTLRLAFRLLLGDRPRELADQANAQAIAARLWELGSAPRPGSSCFVDVTVTT
jgi:hypothetical protein